SWNDPCSSGRPAVAQPAKESKAASEATGRPDIRMAFMSRSIRKAGRGNPPCAGLLAVAMAACLAGTARSAGDQDLFAPAASDNAVLQWDNALLQAVRATIPGPTIVSRAIAVLHTCMFDAWTAYDRTAIPTVLSRGWRR